MKAPSFASFPGASPAPHSPQSSHPLVPWVPRPPPRVRRGGSRSRLKGRPSQGFKNTALSRPGHSLRSPNEGWGVDCTINASPRGCTGLAHPPPPRGSPPSWNPPPPEGRGWEHAKGEKRGGGSLAYPTAANRSHTRTFPVIETRSHRYPPTVPTLSVKVCLMDWMALLPADMPPFPGYDPLRPSPRRAGSA